jgi:hypothetical protein
MTKTVSTIFLFFDNTIVLVVSICLSSTLIYKPIAIINEMFSHFLITFAWKAARTC